MQSLVRDVLAAWRQAERVAARLPAGSNQQQAAASAAIRLRQVFMDLTQRQELGPRESSWSAGQDDRGSVGVIASKAMHRS
jgi:hypothetical protein